MITIRNHGEIIKNAIIERIEIYAKEFSRDERNVIKRFLQDYNQKNILDSLVAEYGWDKEKTNFFLDDFVAYFGGYIKDEDFLRGVLLGFIGNDNDISRKYKAELKAEFEREFEQQKQKLHNELENLDKEQENVMVSLSKSLAKKSKIEKDILSLQSDFDKNLQLANKVDKQIRSKILKSKDNIADFLAEYAMFAPTNSGHLGNYLDGNVFSAYFEEITCEYVLDYLSGNLKAIGISTDTASVLSAYLLAAYSIKAPLIIAGYGASTLVDTLSITLYNKTADRMYINGTVLPTSLGNGKIVMVYNAFSCMDKVIEENKNKFVCFISQTSEELAIEPRSIFNYALPLFTEYFTNEDMKLDEILGCVFGW